MLFTVRYPSISKKNKQQCAIIIGLLMSLTACQTMPNNNQQVNKLPTKTIDIKAIDTTQNPTYKKTNNNTPKKQIMGGQSQKNTSNPFSKSKNSDNNINDYTNNNEHNDNIITDPQNIDGLQTPKDTNENKKQIENNNDQGNDVSNTNEVVGDNEKPSNANIKETNDIDMHQILLERARQNSQANTIKNHSINNKDNLPAFHQLMNQGIKYLQQNQIGDAENSFTTAQRLAPQSSSVYFYLSKIALKKVQPKKAEAIARRGLSVATNEGRRQALWQLILQSAVLQNKAPLIEEAKKALNID